MKTCSKCLKEKPIIDYKITNKGEWCIDHIIPADAFSFKSIYDQEVRECYQLDNLRACWSIDNAKKGTKIVNIVSGPMGEFPSWADASARKNARKTNLKSY